MLLQPWCLMQCVFCTCSFTHVCLNPGNLTVFTVERTHKTTEQICNTWVQPYCHTCMTFAGAVTVTNQAQGNPVKSPICWFKAAQYKEKLLSEFIERTMVDLWNAPPQQKSLKRQVSWWCLPSFVMLQDVLGLCLHCAMFYSKRA